MSSETTNISCKKRVILALIFENFRHHRCRQRIDTRSQVTPPCDTQATSTMYRNTVAAEEYIRLRKSHKKLLNSLDVKPDLLSSLYQEVNNRECSWHIVRCGGVLSFGLTTDASSV